MDRSIGLDVHARSCTADIVGDGLRAKRFEAQPREAMIGVLVINRMTELGMPQSVAVTS